MHRKEPCVLLNFVSKYFVVPFPTTKPQTFCPTNITSYLVHSLIIMCRHHPFSQHNQIINMSPFRTPGLSIIKTVVMTIGEFEYDDVFANTNDDNNQLTDFASLAYLLWILFLVMMPILLVNLLVSVRMCE